MKGNEARLRMYEHEQLYVMLNRQNPGSGTVRAVSKITGWAKSTVDSDLLKYVAEGKGNAEEVQAWAQYNYANAEYRLKNSNKGDK